VLAAEALEGIVVACEPVTSTLHIPVAHQATTGWVLGSDTLRNPNIYPALYLRDIVSW